jgi:hypothetical protein
MTSITLSSSAFLPWVSDVTPSERPASIAIAVAPPRRSYALWQALLRASLYVGDARVAWATGGDPAALLPAITPSAN